MKHDPNLFEAFKDVSERQSEPQAAPKASLPRGGGSALRAEAQPRLVMVVAVLMLASFAGGWFLRGPGESVQAQGPGEQPGEVGGQPATGTSSWLDESWRPEEPPVSPNPPASEVSAASGLYNQANRYTVLAITYSDLPSLESRARTTAQYLRDQGFPAYDPIHVGDSIEILVGAAPTRSELQPLVSRLQGTRGPGGTSFDFQSAYAAPIDPRVSR